MAMPFLVRATDPQAHLEPARPRSSGPARRLTETRAQKAKRMMCLTFLLPCSMLAACVESATPLAPPHALEDAGGADVEEPDVGSPRDGQPDGELADSGPDPTAPHCGEGMIEGFRKDVCGTEDAPEGCDLRLYFTPGDIEYSLPCEGLELIVRSESSEVLRRNFGHLTSRGARVLSSYARGSDGTFEDALAGRFVFVPANGPAQLLGAAHDEDTIPLPAEFERLIPWLTKTMTTLVECTGGREVELRSCEAAP
jgi:hypothetical protein